MHAKEAQERRCVVSEARAWRGAAYHHMARVRPDPRTGERGATDCAQLLACVYHAAGLIAEVPLEYYPPDWHLHRGIERYLDKVIEYARETCPRESGGPLPGDLVLWRWGRCFAHGAIVVGWPRVVHAMAGIGVLEEDIERNGMFRGRPRRFFTLWPAPAKAGVHV